MQINVYLCNHKNSIHSAITSVTLLWTIHLVMLNCLHVYQINVNDLLVIKLSFINHKFTADGPTKTNIILCQILLDA